jgi:addiction module RelE/StbE family toxin
MELIFTKQFQKNAKKIAETHKHKKEKINDCLLDFSRNGRTSKYYRKKLHGKWIGYEELEIGGDIRIVVRIHKNEQIAILENIGTHSMLNL